MDAKKLKKLVKTNVGEKPTFGTNPRDPYSAKYDINETAQLNQYLKSRGINPEFVSKDQKVAHSKTNQFKVWMRSHINDPVRESVTGEPSPTQKRLAILKQSTKKNREVRVPDGHKQLHSEAVDKKDTVTFDIPLLIRVLEFAREELKSDINLHRMVERLISMRGKGPLTMNQYGVIVKEEAIQENLADILSRHAHHHGEMMKAMKSGDKVKQQHHHNELNKVKTEYATHQAKANANKPVDAIAQDYKDQEKKYGIGHVRDHVEVDGEQLDETWKYHTYPTNAEAHAAVKTHHAWRGADGMASGNPARAMGNNKVAYKGEFKGPKPSTSKVTEGVVAAVKRAWKAVSNFDDPSPKYNGQTRRRAVLKQKLGTNKKKVSEAKEANYGGEHHASVLAVKAKAAEKPVDMKSLAARMQAAYRREDEKNKQVKENMEPQAADAQPWDCANNPDDTIKSNRAAKVKLLLGGKKGQVKEETFDGEKEDKSTVPVGGKKTKLQKPGTDSVTRETPQAAAVLTGGKTLTGEPRDTIEIDPMMKMRKQTPDSQKSL